MGQPQPHPSAYPQQPYAPLPPPPGRPHARPQSQQYAQPQPQQVYLIPAAQPQPDKWRKRLLIINGVIACLVVIYLMSQSPQSSVGSEALKADGKSDIGSEQAALRYPVDMAVGEYHEPIDNGERWIVYTQTQDPSSHVELMELRDVRVQDATQNSQFIAERTTLNSQDAGQTITPQVVEAGGRDAYVWSYYDANRTAEIRNLWVPGATMSHRLQCKILDAERARGLQMCESAVASLTVKSR